MLLMIICATPSLMAQDAGIFNSPKGIGASLRTGIKDGAFNTLTAFVDIYGIMTSRCLYPGFRLNASRQFVLAERQGDGFKAQFYVGPGFSAGYVRDHDKGRGIDLGSLMSDNPGLMFAVNADAGCRFDFGREISIDLSFMADAGVHLRRNEKEKQYSAASLSIYNNGLWQIIYPQLTIYFKLP